MRARGFTLVELLVGLAVAAILLTIAIPGYAFLVSTSRLAAVTNDLVTALQLARSEAIRRNVHVSVCKSGGSASACVQTGNWQSGWLVFVDKGTVGVVDGNDLALWSQPASSSGATINTSTYSHYIRYGPDGRSRASNNALNGTFHVCAGGNERDIIISNTGRVRLESGGAC